jgi:hypothetical protein
VVDDQWPTLAEIRKLSDAMAKAYEDGTWISPRAAAILIPRLPELEAFADDLENRAGADSNQQ